MAAVYFIAGVVLIVKSYSTAQQLQAGIIGWVLCGYSIYRIVSRVMLLKKAKSVGFFLLRMVRRKLIKCTNVALAAN